MGQRECKYVSAYTSRGLALVLSLLSPPIVDGLIDIKLRRAIVIDNNISLFKNYIEHSSEDEVLKRFIEM